MGTPTFLASYYILAKWHAQSMVHIPLKEVEIPNVEKN